MLSLIFNIYMPDLLKETQSTVIHMAHSKLHCFDIGRDEQVFLISVHECLNWIFFMFFVQVRTGSRALYRPLSAAVVSDARKADVSSYCNDNFLCKKYDFSLPVFLMYSSDCKSLNTVENRML